MKKIFTLALFMIISSSLFAQKVDYDNDSKWFFGLNVGGTWNTTDVDDKVNAGWGFIFGRQFNYNYGKIASYDLRLRYLGGKWYGQDFDTTSLNGYSPAYMPAPLAGYQNSPGYTVNNFETEVHELGLELAIHANRLRANTGWDPYIFGGINIAWNRTNGDLVNFDSTLFSDGQYDYSQDINKSYVNGILDGDYETAMNQGSELQGFNADVVPSLGFGIGYQVGPRFSLGLEHKTSFALKDDWDGYENSELRWNMFENDVYHYSGGYLRFHIRGGGNANIEQPNNNGTNGLVNNNCDNPIIRITRPSSTGLDVAQQMFAFKAKVERVAGRDNIILRVNGQLSTNFFYNENTSEVEASIILRDGANTIQLEASNGCGTEVKNTTINYVTCKAPVVSYTSPAQNNLHVADAQYVIRATIANNATSVIFRLNGNQSSNFYFNASSGSFESSVTLQEGVNTVQIVASNDCGSDTETITINYSDCEEPDVQFLIANGSIVNDSRLTVKANVLNVAGQNSIGFRVNGANKPFIYNANTRVVESLLTLVSGVNTIQITATNDCGTETETITVTYNPCLDPSITIIAPTTQSSTSVTPSVIFKANVSNVTTLSQIKLKVNGSFVSGGTFSASTNLFQKTITLQEGTNTIQLIATNDCDTDAETITIGYNAPCIDPSVSIVSPIVQNSSTENQTISVSAAVLNVSSMSGIQFSVNGQPVSGGSFANGTFSNNVILQEGVNTIVVSGTNDCGTDSETVTVTYTPCDEPVITMVNPTSTSIQSPNATYPIQAVFQNIDNANQIVVTVNGTVQTGGAYVTGTGLYRNTIKLQSGVNVVIITATNDCGTVTETITISYNPCVAPTVTMINPPAGSVTTSNTTYLVKASVLNVNNVSQIVLKVNGALVAGGTYSNATKIFEKSVTLQVGANVVQIIATNECGTDNKSGVVKKTVVIETPQPVEMMTICVPSRVGNKTMEIPVSEWANYQAQGASMGACPEEEEKMVICHHPPGNPTNTQQLEIPVSAWAAHQAHGDTQGPCPEEVEEEKMVICHHPPGNPTNTQQLEIPVSAWPAHMAHGDTQGPCPEEVEEEKMVICHHPPGNPTNTQELEIPVSAWPAHMAHGDTQGPCPVEEEEEPTMIICHHPPGNRGNTQELEIPVSAWPAHMAHGDTQGPCPEEEQDDEEVENENGFGGLGNPQSNEQQITICHRPPGNPTNTQQIDIPLSAWAAHQAHGDVLGPCPNNSGNNGNGGSNNSGNSGSNTGQEEEQMENGNGFGGLGSPGGSSGSGTEEESGTGSGEESEEIENENGFGGLGNIEGSGGSGGEEESGNGNRTESEEDDEKKKAAALAAKKKAEEEARLKAEAAAKLKAEQEAKAKADAEAKKKAAALAAKKKAEEEARLKAEAAAKLKAEQEAKAKADAEAKKKAAALAAKKKAEEEAKRKAEAAAKLKAEQEAKAKADAEAKKKAEEEAKRKTEAAAKLKAEQEAKAKANSEAKKKEDLQKKKSAEEEEKNEIEKGGGR